MDTLTRSATRQSSEEFAPIEGRLSADDWAALPETKPHYELINGVLQRKMPSRRRHSHVISMLVFLLMQWGYDKGWIFNGEGTGLKVDEFNGYVPDFVGFAPDTQLDPDAVYDGPPFLVAEVLSDSTAANDRDTKMKGYARAHVEIYILIDPNAQTFEVYRLDGESYGAPEVLSANALWQPPEFDGLQLELAKLWM